MPDPETESKSLLTRGIAQEIGNLLTFLLGEISLLRGEKSEEVREARLADMDARLMRASDLHRLLLAQLEKGLIEQEPLNLNEILSSLEESIASGGRRVVVTKFPSLPVVDAVSQQLKQMLKSLISGVTARRPAASVFLRTGTELLSEDRLAEDPIGAGSPSGEYVFCEVLVANDQTDAPFPLTPGLDISLLAGGLEINALIGIIRSHRGLVASGKMGDESMVRVYFPSVETQDKSRVQVRSIAGHQEEWHGTGTALFVDDEESVRILGERLLDAFGFQVVTATDGRDGVQKFRQLADQVRLVVLDVTMPHLNGLEAFKEIRKLKPRVPVLFISGYANAVNEASLDDRAAFLPKPFRMAEMRAKIRQVAGEAFSKT